MQRAIERSTKNHRFIQRAIERSTKLNLYNDQQKSLTDSWFYTKSYRRINTNQCIQRSTKNHSQIHQLSRTINKTQCIQRSTKIIHRSIHRSINTNQSIQRSTQIIHRSISSIQSSTEKSTKITDINRDTRRSIVMWQNDHKKLGYRKSVADIPGILG